jgi:uncharacterized protein YutE (UPF0331/DUF86 family)
MDREVIEQKLESLRRCLLRIRDRCPATVDELARNADIQDILTLNLTRAVQLCVDIGAHLVADIETGPPETMGATFDLLADAGLLSADLAAQLKKAVGFRNIAVHSYEKMDWAIVHAIASAHLDSYEDFARAVVAAMIA